MGQVFVGIRVTVSVSVVQYRLLLFRWLALFWSRNRIYWDKVTVHIYRIMNAAGFRGESDFSLSLPPRVFCLLLCFMSALLMFCVIPGNYLFSTTTIDIDFRPLSCVVADYRYVRLALIFALFVLLWDIMFLYAALCLSCICLIYRVYGNCVQDMFCTGIYGWTDANDRHVGSR